MKKQYRALIVDDEVNSIKLLQASLGDLFPDIDVAGTCTGWQQALTAMREDSFDLLFLDISMPGKSTMDVLKLIPDVSGQIIFITAHQEFAIEAFKFQAAGYLLKPFDDQELSLAVNRAIDRIEKEKAASVVPKTSTPIIGIPGSKGIDYVHLDTILYLQAENKCTRVVLQDRVIYSSYHLGLFRDLFEGRNFFQVHRSYLVNINAVKSYLHNSTTIVMTDNTELPLARAVKDDFLNQFMVINRRDRN